MTLPYQRLTLAQVAAYPRPGTAIPGAIRYTPDSKRVTFLASAEGSLVRSLWAFDPATGERHLLAGPDAHAAAGAFSHEEELRRERLRLRETGVTSYEFAERADPAVLLVPTPAGLRVRRGEAWLDLPGTEGALDAHLSPDGSCVAFVRDGELWDAPTDGDEEPRQLTDGAGDGLTHGVAEFIAAEELDRSRGYWWSPDSARIVYIQSDERHIPDYPIVHQGSPEPRVEHHRYPFAGAENARLRLGIVPSSGGPTDWLDTAMGDDVYIARVGWRPSGDLMVDVLSRDQATLTVLAFDADGRRSMFREETTRPWFNLSHDTRFLTNGETLFSSERTGFRHLYLRSPEGDERPLTGGQWVVTRLVSLDEDRREAWFEGTRESVLERHLYRVSLDGGDVERVTSGPGWHSAAIAPDFQSFVDTHSSLEHAPSVRLRDREGSQLAVVHDGMAVTAASLGLAPPKLMELAAADGTPLHGALYEPGDVPSGEERPLIVSVYGGPHAQRVMDEWSLTVDMRAQYLAQQGYFVFKLDNRGSANRGLAFEAVLQRRFGTVELEDQAAGVEFLARRDEIDTARTGIYGWSYGGYLSALALMRRPDTFRVAVAGAPVADWDGYDTGYTERYMGTPAQNPDGYRGGSLLTHAAKLEGRLLLVHGGVDENVHFRHTARLIVALTEALKPYDLMLYPEERHMPRDAAGLEYMERRLVEYFEQHL